MGMKSEIIKEFLNKIKDKRKVKEWKAACDTILMLRLKYSLRLWLSKTVRNTWIIKTLRNQSLLYKNWIGEYNEYKDVLSIT